MLCLVEWCTLCGVNIIAPSIPNTKLRVANEPRAAIVLSSASCLHLGRSNSNVNVWWVVKERKCAGWRSTTTTETTTKKERNNSFHPCCCCCCRRLSRRVPSCAASGPYPCVRRRPARPPRTCSRQARGGRSCRARPLRRRPLPLAAASAVAAAAAGACSCLSRKSTQRSGPGRAASDCRRLQIVEAVL